MACRIRLGSSSLEPPLNNVTNFGALDEHWRIRSKTRVQAPKFVNRAEELPWRNLREETFHCPFEFSTGTGRDKSTWPTRRFCGTVSTFAVNGPTCTVSPVRGQRPNC